MKVIQKESCKRFGVKERYKKAKLYNKNGIDLQPDDIQFIKPGEILYIALDGKQSVTLQHFSLYLPTSFPTPSWCCLPIALRFASNR